MKILLCLIALSAITSCLSEALRLQPFNAVVSKENRLKGEFRSGNCADTIKNAELSLEQTLKGDPKDTRPFNNLAWLLITCPNSKYVDPKRSLELMSRAEKIKPLLIGELDTVACAKAAMGNFAEAFQIATKHQLKNRIVEFQNKTICKWDEYIGPIIPEPPSAAEIALSDKIKQENLDARKKIANAFTEKPPNVNSAIFACEGISEAGSVHFCKIDLSNQMRKSMSDRYSECEKYDKDPVVARRCYKFYLEYMGGDYSIHVCNTDTCRKNVCLFRPKECPNSKSK